MEKRAYKFEIINAGFGGTEIKRVELFNFFSSYLFSQNPTISTAINPKIPAISLEGLLLGNFGTIGQNENGAVINYSTTGEQNLYIYTFLPFAENEQVSFIGAIKDVAGKPFICKRIKVESNEAFIQNTDNTLEYFKRDANGNEETQTVIFASYITPDNIYTNIVEIKGEEINFLINGWTGFRMNLQNGSYMKITFYNF